ncbi:hypothetical protein QUF90_21845 [Desulfococcaceae bacterium HSG9]|nr:hypothetical protein [Desulfococcaceae bacterium HSG9]
MIRCCIHKVNCVFWILFLLTSCAPSRLVELDSAINALGNGNFELAYQYYEQVLSRLPQNEEALQGIQKLRIKLTKRGINEAKKTMVSVSNPSIPHIHKAIAKLDAFRRYDPQNTLLEPTRRRYKKMIADIKQETKAHVQRVRSALAKNKFKEARENLAYIQSRNPQSTIIPKLEEEYKRAEAVYRERQSQDIKEALKKTIEEMVNKQQYYSAYLAIIESDFKDDFSDKLLDIQIKGSNFYLEQARRRLIHGDTSRAYLESVKGNELDPKAPELFEIYRDTRDAILKKLQKYIAISAFGAPAEKPDLGPQFSDALISYLFRTLPYGSNIVEREKIDLLMKEHKREFEVLGNILNVDMIIIGNVSLMNIDTQKAESVATVRVKSGEKREVNPEYELLQKSKNQEDQKLPLPSAVITTPIYENYTYKKGKTTIKGFATVSVRIFDVRKGSISYAQEFNAKYQMMDEYQDSVEPAGIKGDLLELPSRTEVMENLRNSIIKQLAKVIQDHFEKREEKLLKDAQYFLVRLEIDKAIDALAKGFLYCIKSIKPNIRQDNAAFKKIRNLIVEYTERDYIVTDFTPSPMLEEGSQMLEEEPQNQ